MEASHKKHQPHIKVGNNAEEEVPDLDNVLFPFMAAPLIQAPSLSRTADNSPEDDTTNYSQEQSDSVE